MDRRKDIVFNLRLASEWKKPEKVDEKFSQENEYHAGLMQTGREEALQNLGKYYTLRAFQSSPDDPGSVKLSELMREYYFYLKRYDKQFLRKLSDLVRKLVNTYQNDPERMKKELSMFEAQQQPAEPAMGAPGMDPMMGGDPMAQPMAYNVSRMRKESVRRLYIKRKDKGFLLRNTLVGKLLSGKHDYLDAEGKTRTMSIDGDEDAYVSRVGATAKIIFRLEEDMAKDMMEAISEELVSNGVDDGQEIAKQIVSEYMDDGKIDLKPVMTRISDISKGILLSQGVDGVEEPEEISGLRSVIGRTMSRYIEPLKSSLMSDGISIDEFVYGEDQDESPSRYPTRSTPHVLGRNRIKSSMDARSLVMTIASGETDSEDRAAAIDRLIDLICTHPEAYEAQRLSPSDVRAIESRVGRDEVISQSLSRLKKFVSLFSSDDHGVLRAYSESDPSDRRMISNLVASQGRDEIVKTNPWMGLQKMGDDYLVNDKFVSKMKTDNEESIMLLGKIMTLINGGSLKPSRMLINKVMGALAESGDKRLERVCLDSRSVAKNYAIVRLLEHGTPEDRSLALSSLRDMVAKPYLQDEDVRLMTAVAAVRAGGDDGQVMSLVREALGISPNEIKRYLDNMMVSSYMMHNRVGADGSDLPSSADILEITDDPLPLIKDYHRLAKAGDKDSLAAMHKILLLMGQEPSDDFERNYALRYLQEALVDVGVDESVVSVLVPKEVTAKPAQRRREVRAMPDGNLLVKDRGFYSVYGTDIRFSTSPSQAVKEAMVRSYDHRKATGV